MKKRATPKAKTLGSKAIARAMGVSPINGAFDAIVDVIRALSPPKLSTALRELHPVAVSQFKDAYLLPPSLLDDKVPDCDAFLAERRTLIAKKIRELFEVL